MGAAAVSSSAAVRASPVFACRIGSPPELKRLRLFGGTLARRDAIRNGWPAAKTAHLREDDRFSHTVILRCSPTSAFTRVFDALWASLEGYGLEIPGRRPSRLARFAHSHLRVTVIVCPGCNCCIFQRQRYLGSSYLAIRAFTGS